MKTYKEKPLEDTFSKYSIVATFSQIKKSEMNDTNNTSSSSCDLFI